MDKLKPVLDNIIRFGFWILIGLVAMAVLVCWWMATDSVSADIKTKKETLEKNFSEVEGIANATSPPNPKFIASLTAERDALNEKVLAAWQELYNEQQKRNQWPSILGTEFLSMIKHLGPNEPIPEIHRRTYGKFIKEYLPKLKEAVDWRHPESPAAVHDQNTEVRMVGVVDWNKADIDKLEQKYDSWRTTPSDLAVRLAQEDLWVLESLLGVIRNTNDKTPDHSKAAIKHIDSLDFGESAILAWKQAEGVVYKGSESAAATTTAAAPPAAAGSSPSEEVLLKTNRYVDEKGEPLPAEGAAAGGEFKRMPIRMKLYVNQRKIAKLLVECANSPMPIEVTRVRFNPEKGSLVDFTGGSQSGGGAAPMGAPAGGGPAFGGGPAAGHGAPPGYGPGYGPGFGGGMPRMPRMPTPTAEGGGGLPGMTTAWDKDDMDVPIEILGIICIYNPPDVAKLGKKETSEGEAADATATPVGDGEPATPVEPAPVDKEMPGTEPSQETPAAEPAEIPAAEPSEPAGEKPADTPPAETAAKE